MGGVVRGLCPAFEERRIYNLLERAYLLYATKGESAKCKEGRLFKTDVKSDSKNYSRCGVSPPCRSCWDRTPRLSCARRASLASFKIIWITCTTSNVFNLSKGEV